MRIEEYHAKDAKDIPAGVFAELDGHGEHYFAAFANYPPGTQLVITAWATTGEVKGEVATTLVAAFDGHVITAYIDPLSAVEGSDEDRAEMYARDALGENYPEEISDDMSAASGDLLSEPFRHSEPSRAERLRMLLAYLRQRTQASWLLVHDADEFEVELNTWPEQGFHPVAPPVAIPAEQALVVFVWGEPPKDVYTLLRERGLSWDRAVHRGFVQS